MTFGQAAAIVLSPIIEGGYVFDSHDPGGETNMGISKRSYPHLDIKNLSKEEAIEIYRRDYWEPLKPMLFPSVLRLCLFDCAVNQGLKRAVRMLQEALDVPADGIIGPVTIMGAMGKNHKKILERFILARLEHYSKLPTWPRYGVGWSKRLLHVMYESLDAG